jgi:hypothetical protein
MEPLIHERVESADGPGGTAGRERFLRGELRGPRPPRRRLKPRRLLLFLALLALAAAGIWSALASGRAPELAVDRILVEGNERLSDGEILELVEIDEETNILTLGLDDVREKLLRSAWVRDVEVKRVLPATLTLQIVERTPVAVALLDELYLLAEDGTILDQLSPHSDTTRLVLARGLRRGTSVISQERAELAGRTAETLLEDERLALAVSEIDVSQGDQSIVLQLRSPSLSLLVSADTMAERLREVLPLLGGLTERYPNLERVDLRFQDRVYLTLSELAPGEIATSTEFVPGGASF